MKFVDLLPRDVHVPAVEITSQPAMNVLTFIKKFLCDSIKICIGKSFIKDRYRKCVIYNIIKLKGFAFSEY